MGFFSFGKKKKVEKPSSPSPATTTSSKDKKLTKLVNSASASSSLSNTSSGSSSYSPHRNSLQPPLARRTNTSPAAPNGVHNRHSSALAPPPPLPALAGHGRLSGSSSTSNLRPGSHTSINLSSSNTSLALPNAPYANGNSLAKKGSSATLNSVRSVGGTPLKRGPHDPPARASGLGSASGSSSSLNNPFNKQRAASYGYGVRNIWTTGTDPRSADGHEYAGYNGTHPAVFAGKHASTGSPGMLANGSSYINAHNTHHALATDNEFKAYTRKYDMIIAKAHTLAREYHHLPPAKRDQAGFERIGYAFASAAGISREHWSMRCTMEKERLEALLSRRKKGDVLDEANQEESSPHRVAGMRACEGWQYASMLADAWGVKDETATPLEEMPVLKPKYPTSNGYRQNTASWHGDSGANYMHPGHSPAAYASYISQQQQHPPVTRGRYDSTASRASRTPSFSESVHMAFDDGRERANSLSSSHTHSVLSHMPNGYTTHPYPSTTQGRSSNHGQGSNHGHGGYVSSPLNRSAPGLAMTADEHGMRPYVEASHEYITPAVRGQITRSRTNSETIEKVEERQPIVLRRGIKHRKGSLGGRSVEGATIAAA